MLEEEYKKERFRNIFSIRIRTSLKDVVIAKTFIKVSLCILS